MLFTIDIESPPTFEISEIRVEEEQKRILIAASTKGMLAPESTLIARIPRTLLDNITTAAVESEQGSSPIEFLVNEVGPVYTTISVELGNHAANTEDIRLAIY